MAQLKIEEPFTIDYEKPAWKPIETADYKRMKEYNESKNSPIIFNNTNSYYSGMLFKSIREKELFQIIEYRDKKHVQLRFLNDGNYTTIPMTTAGRLRVKNPMHRHKTGGMFGYGPYTKRQHMKIYSTWSKMLIRVMEENQNYSRNAHYAGCTVDPYWYTYQNFAFWYDTYISGLNQDYYEDYQIDKDIFQWNQPNKIYGPYTCCLIPSKLNMFLSDIDQTTRGKRMIKDLPLGVTLRPNGKYMASVTMNENVTYKIFDTPEEAFKFYKQIKGNYIRDLADYYYSQNRIRIEVKEALYYIANNIKPF